MPSILDVGTVLKRRGPRLVMPWLTPLPVPDPIGTQRED